MAEAAKKSSKMLRAIDKCRNFANGSTSRKGGFQTSRTIKRASSGFLIHVNLARFPESVKSWRTMSTSRIGGVGCFCRFVDSGCARTYVGKEDRCGLTPFLFVPQDNK